jgi:cytochrome c biogenesis protein CcdA
LSLKFLLMLGSLLPGFVLILVLVLVVAGIVNELLTNQRVQAQLVVLLLVLALLWWVYLQLPHFIRNMFRSLWPKSRKDKRQH